MSAMTKLSDGVEWAAHACAVLAALPADVALSATALAAFHALPRAYMAKHMQALARAGVVTAARGAGGGYRLARPAAQISLWDVRRAIAGPGPDFKCRAIRERGPCVRANASTRPCDIATAFWQAESAYQQSLGSTSIADLLASVVAASSAAEQARFVDWVSGARQLA